MTSKAYAIVHAKCPRCRRGDMFSDKIWTIRQRMYDKCPVCSQKFEIEPGYFYASMYVSYALSVAELIGAGVATYVITGRLDVPDLWLYLSTTFGTAIVLAPLNFRYSRVLLLHWLSPKVHYDPKLDI